jgi:hypothetical protein
MGSGFFLNAAIAALSPLDQQIASQQHRSRAGVCIYGCMNRCKVHDLLVTRSIGG